MTIPAPIEPLETDPAGAPLRATTPGHLLRVEGLLLLSVSVAAYAHLGRGWWLFFVLLLAPDVGLLGYLAGPRWGSLTYNATHTLAMPLALGLVGLAAGSDAVIGVALVWSAHIGMDRMLGYGLKYPTHFRDTHLQRVG